MSEEKQADRLTPKQQQIIRFIVERIASGGPPTYDDIALRFGFASRTGVMSHVEALAHKGYLIHTAGKHAGMSVPGLKLAVGFEDSEQGRRLDAAINVDIDLTTACHECAEKFATSRPARLYCSRACQNAAAWRRRTERLAAALAEEATPAQGAAA